MTLPTGMTTTRGDTARHGVCCAILGEPLPDLGINLGLLVQGRV